MTDAGHAPSSPAPPLPRHVPWNGIFWGVTAMFFAGAVFFGVGTYLIVTKEQAQARVRMLGIRAFDPVVNEREVTAFGHASVSFLKQWALNKPVKIVFDEPIKDVRGRYLAYVERGGIDLNEKMVEEGIVAVYTEYGFVRQSAYLTTESLAGRSARGIWGSNKAKRRVIALRNDWAHHRQVRTGELPPDYLLSGSAAGSEPP